MTDVKSGRMLESLLPHVAGLRPERSDSALRLLSLVRIYAALFRLAGTVAGSESFCGGSYSERCGRLFGAVCGKWEDSTDFSERCSLCSAMFLLSTGTSFAVDTRREEVCYDAAETLAREYWANAGGDAVSEARICRCLAELFYPVGDGCSEHEWFGMLKGRIGEWARDLTEEGCWRDTSPEAALERMEAMNMNSYMLLDDRYDSHMERAYEYYMRDTGCEDLPTAAVKYDLSRSFCDYGRAECIARDMMMRLNAGDAMRRGSVGAAGGMCDEDIMALSCFVSDLCDRMVLGSDSGVSGRAV